MNTTNIYALLTPIALGFILLEMVLCWYYKKKFIRFQEAVANFGTALGNQTMNVLVAAGVYMVCFDIPHVLKAIGVVHN